MSHRLALSPHCRLFVEEVDVSEPVPGRAQDVLDADIVAAFGVSSASGLIALGARSRESTSRADVLFWRDFADAFVTALAHTPEASAQAPFTPASMPLSLGFELVLRIPAIRGAEYATPELFSKLWEELNTRAAEESAAAGGVRTWLRRINPALHLVGRVTFHLAENKRSPETPFAFMATYTHRLTAEQKPIHLPLARALQDYAGEKNQVALRSLLEPVQRAAERSAWARDLLESRRLFQPQAWTPSRAYAFLREVPALEDAGIVVRIPDWWKNGRGPRPKVGIRIGDTRSSGLGLDNLLSFKVEKTLDGEPLSPEEWQHLMASTENLVLLRGRWVEVDREKLADVLEHWKSVAGSAAGDGLSFLQGMRLLAGTPIAIAASAEQTEDAVNWSEVRAGTWLQEALERLRRPETAAGFDPNEHLRVRLRPYQENGVKWLWFLQHLGLGSCLADDMGLGKTVQVIALLLRLKHEARTDGQHPSLVIVPASLLSNWKSEFARFAPTLSAGFLHPSETPSSMWRDAATSEAFLAGKDVVLTTYTLAAQLDWLAARTWRLVILDEAQAIKNPGARQTRAAKRIPAVARIALSGTPVENRLGDLWSLFDFLNPGLLGTATQFSSYAKRLQAAASPDFSPLRRLVQPYLLRRMKTDRTIIADLPDKTEMTAWCSLSKKQAALYEQSVGDLARQLKSVAEGIERRGLVLAFLMRFKQICNHPSHWLGDHAFTPDESGKFERLSTLVEEIASRQEKVLVFTQFREMTQPLAKHLETVFGRPGLVLHGSTPVKERRGLVEAFQREDGPPCFVLSVKAGGTGLNLTAANHVIHFDRWWNPAVENQATDRAFRIGQNRNVLVHKFVCRGTIEERIDALITQKRALAESLLGTDAGAEKLLSEMSNDELLRFVALDLNAVGGNDR